jgi:hypothetical protein
MGFSMALSDRPYCSFPTVDSRLHSTQSDDRVPLFLTTFPNDRIAGFIAFPDLPVS